MHTYIFYKSEKINTFTLKNFENELTIPFSESILKIHPINLFLKEVKSGSDKIEFNGITFYDVIFSKEQTKLPYKDDIEYFDDYDKIQFTTEADFDTVSNRLLWFKNKYKISLQLLRNNTPDCFPLDFFLKVEYKKHFDKPNGDFLVTKNMYLDTIDVTKEGNQQHVFNMFMTFKHEGEKYEEIFIDPESDACLDIDLNKKTFCTIYTYAKINELVDFLVSNKND